jgi:hypothetical protein
MGSFIDSIAYINRFFVYSCVIQLTSRRLNETKWHSYILRWPLWRWRWWIMMTYSILLYRKIKQIFDVYLNERRGRAEQATARYSESPLVFLFYYKISSPFFTQESKPKTSVERFFSNIYNNLFLLESKLSILNF